MRAVPIEPMRTSKRSQAQRVSRLIFARLLLLEAQTSAHAHCLLTQAQLGARKGRESLSVASFSLNEQSRPAVAFCCLAPPPRLQRTAYSGMDVRLRAAVISQIRLGS